MLTVKILDSMNLNNNDDLKWLEKVKSIDKEFYNYLINNFSILNIIQVLKEKRKAYLPNGLIIEIEAEKDYFKISNIFTNEITYNYSIFNQ